MNRVLEDDPGQDWFQMLDTNPQRSITRSPTSREWYEEICAFASKADGQEDHS